MLNPATKEWIQLILDALTAFGTVSAVIVALLLARRERKEVIRGRAEDSMLLGTPGGGRFRIVNVHVTNLTLRPVTINSIGWRVGIFRHQYADQVPDFGNPLSSQLPTKLNYAEQANYNFPFEEFLNNASDLCASISTVWPWLRRRFIFLAVVTSGNPGSFLFRVGPELARALVNRAKEVKASLNTGVAR